MWKKLAKTVMAIDYAEKGEYRKFKYSSLTRREKQTRIRRKNVEFLAKEKSYMAIS